MDENKYIIMTWQKFCDLAHINDSIHGYAEVGNVVGNCQTQRELEQLLKKHFVFDDNMKKEFDEANKSAREKFALDTLRKTYKAKTTSFNSDVGGRHLVEFIDLVGEFLNMTIDEISKMKYDSNFSSRERSRAKDVYFWLQPKNFSLIAAQLPSEYKQIEEILEAVVQNAFKNDTHNQDLFKGMFEGGSLDIDPSDSSEDIRTILTNKIDIIDSCILLICSEEQNQKWNETKQRHWHGKGEAKSPRNHIIDDLLKEKEGVRDVYKSGDSIGKQLAFSWSIRDDENFKLKWLKDKPSIAEAKEAMFQCELYVHKLPLLLGELREKGLNIPGDINEQFVQNQQVLVKKIAQLNQRQESDIEEVISQAIEEIEKKHKHQFDLFTRKQREKTIGSDDIDNYVKGFIERNFGETCSALLESGIEAYEDGNVSCQDGIKTRLEYAEQAIKVRTGATKPRDIVDSYKDAYEGINDKQGLFIALGMECISMSFDPKNVEADDLKNYYFKAAATYESVIEQDILGIRQEAFNRYKKALKQNRSEVDKLTLSHGEYSKWSQMLERLYKENPEDVKREQMKLLPYAVEAMKDRFKPKQQVVTDSRIIEWIQGQQGYPFCRHNYTDLSDLLTAEIKVEETWNKLKKTFPGDFQGIALDTRECNSQNELIEKLIILTDKDEKAIKERIDKANSAIKRVFYRMKLRCLSIPENEHGIDELRKEISKKLSPSNSRININKLRKILEKYPDSLKKGLAIPPKRELPYKKMQPDNDENRMRLDQYVYSEPSDIEMLLQKCSQLFPEGMDNADITEIKKTIILEHKDFNEFCSQYRKKLQEFGIPPVSIQMLDFSFIYSQCKSKEMLYDRIQADKEKYGLEISEFQKRKDLQYHCLYMLESRYKKKIPIDSDDISIINSLGNSIMVPVFELLTTEEQNLLKSRALESLLSADENCTAFDDEKEYHMATLYQVISDHHEEYPFLKKHIDAVCQIYEDRLYNCLVEIFEKGNANDQNLEFLAQIINIMNQGYYEKPLRIDFEIPEEEMITKDNILEFNPQIKQWYDVQKSGAVQGILPTDQEDYDNLIKAAITGNQISGFDSFFRKNRWEYKRNDTIKELAIQQARRGHTYFAKKLMYFNEIHQALSDRPDIVSQMIDKAFTDNDHEFIIAITAKAMLEFKPLVLTEEVENYEDRIKYTQLKKLYRIQGAIRTHSHYKGLTEDIKSFNNSDEKKDIAKAIAYIAFESKNDDFFDLIYPKLSRNMKDHILIGFNEKMNNSDSYSFPIVKILERAINTSNAAREYHYNNTLKGIEPEHIKKIVIQEAKKGNLTLAQKMLTFSEITDEFDTPTVNKMIDKAFREPDFRFINSITNAAMLHFDPPLSSPVVINEYDAIKRPDLLKLYKLGKAIRQHDERTINLHMDNFISENSEKTKKDLDTFLQDLFSVAYDSKCSCFFDKLFCLDLNSHTDKFDLLITAIKLGDKDNYNFLSCILPSLVIHNRMKWDPTKTSETQFEIILKSWGSNNAEQWVEYTLRHDWVENTTKEIIKKKGKCSQAIIDWLARKACVSNSPDDFVKTFEHLPADKKSHLIKLFCSSHTGYVDKRLSLIKGILISLEQNLAMEEINPLTQMYSDFRSEYFKIGESKWLPKYWINQYPDVAYDHLIVDLFLLPIVLLFTIIQSAVFDNLKNFSRDVHTVCIKPIIDFVTIICVSILIMLTSIISIINFFLRCIRLKNRDSIYTITRDKALKESNTSKKVQYAYNFLGLVGGLQNKGITDVEKIRRDIEKIINSIPKDCNYIDNLTEKSEKILQSLSTCGANEIERRGSLSDGIDCAQSRLSDEYRHRTTMTSKTLVVSDQEEELEGLSNRGEGSYEAQNRPRR